MFRAYFITFLLIIYSIITLPLTILGFIASKTNKTLQFKIGRLLTVIPSNIFFALSGAKVTVNGLENIPKDVNGVLFVGNHKSLIDIPLLLKYVDIHIAFIAKKELKKAPFISWWMSFIGCLFLDRQNVRQGMQTILEGVKKLKAGESLVIFPEGTRSKTDEMLPFKQGSLKLASKANVPIIPFAVKGTNEVFEDNGFKLVPNKVSLTFGEPIYLDHIDKEIQKTSAKYVQEIVEKLRSEMV